jgi:filamin
MNRKGKPIPRGEASYTIAAFAPDGSPLEVTQVDNGDGTISCEYCPVMPGDHRVAVQLGNAQIKGSVYRPFVKPSADPSKSYAEGPGLVSARDDEPGLFTVYAKDPDGNPVAGANPIVQVVPSDGKTLDAEVKDNGNGTYSVSYPPLPAGDATVYVRLGDQDIKDTPVVVNVTKGINSTTTFADGPGVAPSVFVGRPMPFVIHACDEDANPLTKGGDNFVINFRGPQGPIKVNCEDAKNGNYPCSYTAPMNANGPATLDIVNKRDNKSIKDCPLQINLKLPADHSKSYAEGPGLQKAWDDRENSFTIYAFDRNNQPVVGEDVKVLLAYPTDGKGAAPARATPSPSASVSNEPEFLTVTETEMAKFCAECGEGNQKAKFCWNCGAKTRIKEVTKQVPNPNFRRGAAAAPQASAGAVNYTHEGKVVDNGDGTYACTYAVQLGMPVVVINAHIYGKEIRGVPVRLQVTKGASAAQSTADGPGVESGFVNRPHRFKITARDEDGKPLATGGDNFQATVTDPNGNDVPCTVIDNGNGTYSAGYVPTVVGPHTVQVDLLKNGASDAIRDMPKTANVRKGASGKNSYMKGKGLRWAYEGRSNTFEVRRFTDTSKETLEQTLLRPLSFVILGTHSIYFNSPKCTGLTTHFCSYLRITGVRV